jgi:glycosyltransferase involved in cell wall biosynthesis
MKIAMVSDWFPPKPGGVETAVYELSSELASRRGIEVEVITENYPKTFTFSDRVEGIDGFKVRRLAGVVVPRWKVYFHPEMPFKLKELFKREDYDVVHTHHLFTPLSVFAAGIAKFMYPPRKCVVATNHSYHTWAERSFFRFFSRFTVGSTQPDRVIAISEVSARLAERLGVNPERIRRIPLGVNLEKFNPSRRSEELRRELGADSSVVILYLGRLVERKGVHYLLMALQQVLKEVKEVKLVVVGEGPWKGRLMKLSRELGLGEVVEFLGYKSREEVWKYCVSCDFMVAPSTHHESFGLVVVEAMASGRPIIATDVTGFNEVFVEGTGFLIPPRDVGALREKILLLARDRKLREEMGRRAREEAVRRYSWKEVADRTLEVYDEVLSQV